MLDFLANTVTLGVLLLVFAGAGEAIALLFETWKTTPQGNKKVTGPAILSLALIALAIATGTAREILIQRDSDAKDSALLAAQKSEQEAIRDAEKRIIALQEKINQVDGRDFTLTLTSDYFIRKGEPVPEYRPFPTAILLKGSISWPGKNQSMSFSGTLRRTGEPEFVAVGFRATPVRRLVARYELAGVRPAPNWKSFSEQQLDGAVVAVRLKRNAVQLFDEANGKWTHTIHVTARGHSGRDPGEQPKVTSRNRGHYWDFETTLEKFEPSDS